MGTHARQSAAPTRRNGIVADWRSQPIALRVLRVFLGVTFVYAGIQKLADPNFLHVGTPDYVGSQLQAFANGSPIAWLLRAAGHVPVLTGLGIALLEIAIGLGTLLGVARYAAALAGFGVSAVLFLSATWRVHPYFLGSDSAYAVAWLAYLAGMWELDRRRRPAATGRAPIPHGAVDPGRRAMMRGAILAGATVLLAGAARVVMGKPATPAAGFGPPTPTRAPGTGTRHGGSSGRTPSGARRPSPAGTSDPGPGPSPGATQSPEILGRTIASLDQFPVGSAMPFTGPGGQPCALFRLGPSKVAAYSRICTHAGCEVGYDSGSRLLVCPCHGAEFDPSRGAAPVAGPAPSPLPAVQVVIDRSRGAVVLPD